MAQLLAENGEDAPLADHAAFLIEMFQEVRPDLQDKIDQLETTEATRAAITATEIIMGKFFPDNIKKPITLVRTPFSIMKNMLNNFAALVKDRSATYESMESLVREELDESFTRGEITEEEALQLWNDFNAQVKAPPA